MRLTDHSARSAPTACWDGLRGTVRCSSVAAVEQALPKSRARAGGHGIVLILRACDWSKSLDFIGLWARVHCRIVVLKSAKSPNSRVGAGRRARTTPGSSSRVADWDTASLHPDAGPYQLRSTCSRAPGSDGRAVRRSHRRRGRAAGPPDEHRRGISRTRALQPQPIAHDLPC